MKCGSAVHVVDTKKLEYTRANLYYMMYFFGTGLRVVESFGGKICHFIIFYSAKVTVTWS